MSDSWCTHFRVALLVYLVAWRDYLFDDDAIGENEDLGDWGEEQAGSLHHPRPVAEHRDASVWLSLHGRAHVSQLGYGIPCGRREEGKVSRFISNLLLTYCESCRQRRGECRFVFLLLLFNIVMLKSIAINPHFAHFSHSLLPSLSYEPERVRCVAKAWRTQMYLKYTSLWFTGHQAVLCDIDIDLTEIAMTIKFLVRPKNKCTNYFFQ